jgi:hypothetical protein
VGAFLGCKIAFRFVGPEDAGGNTIAWDDGTKAVRNDERAGVPDPAPGRPKALDSSPDGSGSTPARRTQDLPASRDGEVKPVPEMCAVHIDQPASGRCEKCEKLVCDQCV